MSLLDTQEEINVRIAKIEDECGLNLQSHLKTAIKIAIIEAQADAGKKALDAGHTAVKRAIAEMAQSFRDIIEAKT